MRGGMLTSSHELPRLLAPTVLQEPSSEAVRWSASQLAFFTSEAVQHEVFGRVGAYIDFWSDFAAAVERNEERHLRHLRAKDPNICRVRLERRRIRIPDVPLPHESSLFTRMSVPRGVLTLDAEGRRMGEDTIMGGLLPSIHDLPSFEPLRLAGDERVYALRLHQTYVGERVSDQVRWTSDAYVLFLELRDGRVDRGNFWVFALCCRRTAPEVPSAIVRRIAGFVFSIRDAPASPRDGRLVSPRPARALEAALPAC